MTIQEFVKTRLVNMMERPAMWASTKESFGLQLVLLSDISQLDTVAPNRPPPYLVMREIFGPEPAIPSEPLDDEWARAAVRTVAKLLGLLTP